MRPTEPQAHKTVAQPGRLCLLRNNRYSTGLQIFFFCSQENIAARILRRRGSPNCWLIPFIISRYIHPSSLPACSWINCKFSALRTKTNVWFQNSPYIFTKVILAVINTSSLDWHDGRDRAPSILIYQFDSRPLYWRTFSFQANIHAPSGTFL